MLTEVEYLKGQLEDTKKAIKKEQNKEMMKELADHLHDMYKAFLDAGFTEEQALYLTGTTYEKQLKRYVHRHEQLFAL